MSLLGQLKSAFIYPMSVRVPVDLIGQTDQWGIHAGSIGAGAFVVSAGVGHSISFEQELASRFDVTMVLLDPSPTGIATVARLDLPDNIEFRAVGLSAASGHIAFGYPDRSDEGSFRKTSAGEGLTFECTTLQDILKQHSRSQIDLLKIDIEGFEYEIIDSILANDIDIRQICVEVHHNRVISIENTIVDAGSLVLRLFRKGYRIIYNKNMDFTFIRKELALQ